MKLLPQINITTVKLSQGTDVHFPLSDEEQHFTASASGISHSREPSLDVRHISSYTSWRHWNANFISLFLSPLTASTIKGRKLVLSQFCNKYLGRHTSQLFHKGRKLKHKVKLKIVSPLGNLKYRTLRKTCHITGKVSNLIFMPYKSRNT